VESICTDRCVTRSHYAALHSADEDLARGAVLASLVLRGVRERDLDALPSELEDRSRSGLASGEAEEALSDVADRERWGDSSLGASDTLKTVAGSGLLMLMMEERAESRISPSVCVAVVLSGWLVAKIRNSIVWRHPVQILWLTRLRGFRSSMMCRMTPWAIEVHSVPAQSPHLAFSATNPEGTLVAGVLASSEGPISLRLQEPFVSTETGADQPCWEKPSASSLVLNFLTFALLWPLEADSASAQLSYTPA
jgi:hypothetical protein